MSFEIIIFLITLFGLAGIGTPVGYSIIASSILYFSFGDMDIALAGEKILQGLYKSFILLAVPLFITAANIMNVGTITDRLLSFCIAAVGRFKGGLGHVNVVASLIFSEMIFIPLKLLFAISNNFSGKTSRTLFTNFLTSSTKRKYKIVSPMPCSA